MGNEGKSEHSVQSTFPAIIRPELLTGRHLELEGPCPAAVATTEVDPSSWVHGRTAGLAVLFLRVRVPTYYYTT